MWSDLLYRLSVVAVGLFPVMILAAMLFG